MLSMDRSITLGMLAELVEGQVVGNAAKMICGAAVLREVTRGEITFIDQAERVKQLATTDAAAVLIPASLDSSLFGVGDDPARCAAVRVKDVHAAFAKIVTYFRPPRIRESIGVSPQAIIARSARLGKNVNIHPAATIGDDCTIGDDTTILAGAHIGPGCTIGSGVLIASGAILYENTVVGDRSIVHGGAVIGAYGFGYSVVGGKHTLSAQLGYVRLGCDVEIGAATTIDRGTYGATTIGDGTKIDNLVQIAHNCQIGRHNLICSQVGVAGSTSTGDYVVMGGQAGVRDHVHIGNRAVLSAMAGITNSVPDGTVMMGVPATPDREQKLKLAAAAKLPEMRKEFKAMRKALAELEKAVGLPQTKLHDADQAA
jgi:UDP-3-O-[3-hydroxymyristoyl] glucosamine N-acyltransferase